jgi:(p)ppGpp synthase/HD superfamily hydrolase
LNRYEALKHAVKAHAGTLDKCGQSYVLHPIAVGEAIESGPNAPERGEAAWRWVYGGGKEDAVVVALLHDVWEDTEYELDRAWFTDAQWDALYAITRQPDETYAASIVKLADLHHNLSPERQACLPEKEQRSLEKRYLKARGQIWEALGFEWWPAQ